MIENMIMIRFSETLFDRPFLHSVGLQNDPSEIAAEIDVVWTLARTTPLKSLDLHSSVIVDVIVNPL